jgi:ABC-type multidrug transport system ATPase subunit
MSIQVQNISKSYKNNLAVASVSFDVKEGEIFGLIGPDGAGKKRFSDIDYTLLPNEGTATIAGFDVVRDYKSIRSSYCYMPGKFSLYQDLTIAENLTFSPLSLELRSKKTTMPLKKFTSRLSLLKIEEQPFLVE